MNYHDLAPTDRYQQTPVRERPLPHMLVFDTKERCLEWHERGLVGWDNEDFHFSFTPKVRRWLRKNVGKEGVAWNTLSSMVGPFHARLYFARKSDAMRFKLTFL